MFWSASGDLLDASSLNFTDIHQSLDLWTGKLTSRFSFQGSGIMVETAAADETSSVGITMCSSLVRSGRLGVFLDFPWNDGKAKFSAPFVGNWNATANHTTVLEATSAGSASIVHTMDSASFETTVVGDGFNISRDTLAAHRYTLQPLAKSSCFSIAADYSLHGSQREVRSAISVFAESAKAWERYWTQSGFVDVLTGSADPRAEELQRRIILSRYLMRVNEADPIVRASEQRLGTFVCPLCMTLPRNHSHILLASSTGELFRLMHIENPIDWFHARRQKIPHG